MNTIPDLLNHTPKADVNLAKTRRDLDFAFTTGDSSSTLEQALGESEVAPSDWESECFAEDLFVADFINICLNVQIGDFKAPINPIFLKRALCHPPNSLDTILFRQKIQKELLEHPVMQVEFETLYKALINLRRSFDCPELIGRVYSARRRIDILTQIKRAIDLMAGVFVKAESGLTRIRDYALEIQKTEGYRKLAEFLNYENHLSTVQLQIRVGADGSIRGFHILRLQENEKNRFYEHPVRRFFNRLMFLLRGYRLNNDELVERWIDKVFSSILKPLSYFLQLIGDMEFHLTAIHFSSLCRSRNLDVCFPEFLAPDSKHGRSIQRLFNPLLLARNQTPVPCDITIGSHDVMTIITGPNSGGKTRLLQALGLIQMLGQTGFVVPAKKAQLRQVSGVFVSLIEGTRADQREGRLGMELLRIRWLFEKLRPGALVIFDELCSGTNPSEGEKIFFLVISLLYELHPETFISTHFLRFAKQLASDPGDLILEFLQVDLDKDQTPTYNFIPGVAGTSLAQNTAARLGVTREELLELITKNMS